MRIAAVVGSGLCILHAWDGVGPFGEWSEMVRGFIVGAASVVLLLNAALMVDRWMDRVALFQVIKESGSTGILEADLRVHYPGMSRRRFDEALERLQRRKVDSGFVLSEVGLQRRRYRARGASS